ncbi:MAG: hypothetical protein ABIT16_03615 [Croceibacterium sp.]
MNVWEFVLIISIAGMIYGAWRTKHLARHGAYEDDRGKVQKFDSAREAELEQEVRELRERLQVLERIATDDRGPRLLSDEIEKLRDK